MKRILVTATALALYAPVAAHADIANCDAKHKLVVAHNFTAKQIAKKYIEMKTPLQRLRASALQRDLDARFYEGLEMISKSKLKRQACEALTISMVHYMLYGDAKAAATAAAKLEAARTAKARAAPATPANPWATYAPYIPTPAEQAANSAKFKADMAAAPATQARLGVTEQDIINAGRSPTGCFAACLEAVAKVRAEQQRVAAEMAAKDAPRRAAFNARLAKSDQQDCLRGHNKLMRSFSTHDFQTDPAKWERFQGAIQSIDILGQAHTEQVMGGHRTEGPSCARSYRAVACLRQGRVTRRGALGLYVLALNRPSVVPVMRERRHGCIVSVTSLAGRTGIAPLGPYAVSKWAFEALNECLAHEMKAFNVRVAICDTDIRQGEATVHRGVARQALRISSRNLHGAWSFREKVARTTTNPPRKPCLSPRQAKGGRLRAVAPSSQTTGFSSARSEHTARLCPSLFGKRLRQLLDE